MGAAESLTSLELAERSKALLSNSSKVAHKPPTGTKSVSTEGIQMLCDIKETFEHKSKQNGKKKTT